MEMSSSDDEGFLSTQSQLSSTDYHTDAPSPASVPQEAPATSTNNTRGKTAVLLQPACALHTWTRTNSTIGIVERPERLRAVKVGIAAAVGRLDGRGQQAGKDETAGELDALLQGLSIENTGNVLLRGTAFDVLESSSSLSPDSAILSLVHSSPNSPSDATSYGAQIVDWCDAAPAQIASYRAALRNPRPDKPAAQSEIPAHLAQGDLYLNGDGSKAAIFGAAGAVMDAVDKIMVPNSDYKSAFVAVRPPGHHCETSTPMGFCFLNNALIGAAHAYEKYGVDRYIVIDIDLHHGNGTQEVMFRLNEAHRKWEADGKQGKEPLWGMYGSLHDIYSYPCEESDSAFVQAASINIAGAHDQHISNVHLQPYTSTADFYQRLYPSYVSALLTTARQFFHNAGSDPSRTMVFLSAGFDASEHESAGMSRHGRKVPVGFFARFGRDIKAFADEVAGGKCVAVLEGGYSDRALGSGVMALLSGMTSPEEADGVKDAQRDQWWSVDNLAKLEKACSPASMRPKRTPGGRSTSPSKLAKKPAEVEEPWLASAVKAFQVLDVVPASTAASSTPVAAAPAEEGTGKMALRERTRTPMGSPRAVVGSAEKATRRAEKKPAAAARSFGGSPRGAVAETVFGGPTLASVVATTPVAASHPPAPPGAAPPVPASASSPSVERNVATATTSSMNSITDELAKVSIESSISSEKPVAAALNTAPAQLATPTSEVPPEVKREEGNETPTPASTAAVATAGKGIKFVWKEGGFQ